MIDGLLHEVEPFQEEVDVKLLAHLGFAVQPPLHLFPLFEAPYPGAYFVHPEEDEGEYVEVGKVDLFVPVLEKLRCDVQFEGHQHKLIHEYHEPHRSSDQSTHIREPPVYFSERSFIGGLYS